jgi:5-methylcytosine-specific restriction endonuclease McrA
MFASRVEESRLESRLREKERRRVRSKIRGLARRNAMVGGVPSKRLKESHLSSQDGKCGHCGTTFDNSVKALRPELDHKERLAGVHVVRRGTASERVESNHTLDNTWLLCGICHHAKTGIENNIHIVAKHRYRSIWLSRSVDGKWHLPQLQKVADTNLIKCKRRGRRFCGPCQYATIRMITSAWTSKSGTISGTHHYKLESYKLSSNLITGLISQGLCPYCGQFQDDFTHHIKSEHPENKKGVCPWCRLVIRGRKAFASHVQSQNLHPNVCFLCDRRFERLSSHFKAKHPSFINK